MKKKILISILCFSLFMFSFSFTFLSFANNMMSNAMEGFNEIENKAENTISNTMDSMTNMESTNNYVATRTSSSGTMATGIDGTLWTTLIVGITSVLVVALIWYYLAQRREINSFNDKD